jgi:hypothetical protein
MRDLVAVDRQLAELGPALERKQVAALLDRLLGSDRSLERLNESLDGLGGSAPLSVRPAALRDPLGGPSPRAFGERPRSDPPVTRAPNPPGVRGSLPPRIVSPLAPVQGDSLKTATPWPPVTSPQRSRDTLVDAVPAPAIATVDEQELDAETAALFGITMPPAASPEPAAPEPAAPAPEPSAPASPFPMTPAEAAALSSSPPPVISSLPPPAAVPDPAPAAEPSGRVSRSTLQWAAGVDSSPPAEPAAANVATPPAPAPPDGEPLSSRMSTRQLLDQELDPSEFPSSHPPRARSLPPPLPGGQPQRPAAEAQDSFEMLIDDSEEDIMEIDDVELEEIE